MRNIRLGINLINNTKNIKMMRITILQASIRKYTHHKNCSIHLINIRYPKWHLSSKGKNRKK
jgi:hypothetical protein